jgi:hypothetical protein
MGTFPEAGASPKNRPDLKTPPISRDIQRSSGSPFETAYRRTQNLISIAFAALD